MSPEELRRLCSCLSMAAEVVEAIDSPELQRQRGWDLSRWRYELVPWGVRFWRGDPQPTEGATVLALLGHGPHRRDRL